MKVRNAHGWGKGIGGKKGKEATHTGDGGGGCVVPVRAFLKLLVMVVMWDFAVLTLGVKALGVGCRV